MINLDLQQLEKLHSEITRALRAKDDRALVAIVRRNEVHLIAALNQLIHIEYNHTDPGER